MGEKLKILVVDDDRRMVKTICDILRVKGYDATAAYSGEEAVAQVKAADPGCVLMDIKMPGMSGVETLRLIKAAAPELPVVLMSAYATDEQAREAKRLGAFGVLTKPIDFQQVLTFLSLLRREESILVVDDDPAFSRTLKDILQARDYRVVTEADPGRVLGHMERDDQLVVVLDLKLGTASGLEVLKTIRGRYPDKPVVLVTGYRDEMAASIESSLGIGAYTCLYKPLAMDELLGIFAEIRRRQFHEILGEPA